MPIHDDWILAATPPTARNLPIASPAIRSILTRRGVSDDVSFRLFSSPTLDDLHDPSTIHGMSEACARIEKAIRDAEQILIYGDYDVDGVTSIVLLRTVLRALGATVDFVIPHRLVDGYGLKTEVLERVLAEKKVGLVITVDCGISSVEPVERALARGIDVIITDHHLPPGTLPSAAAVLNPKQPGCEYPFKDLAGVGVAFKLCCELIKRRGHSMSIASLVKIAAIGTIADVAPLVGENRTIARLGLLGLADARNRGLRNLFGTLGLNGRPLRSHDVGFKIGPRINAAGRLASADTAIELFSALSDDEALTIVAELNRLNAERQRIELEVIKAAEQQITDAKILVLAGEGWHKGVLGLCAGRIAQRTHRPTLLVSIEGDRCVGSGRSISTIDLHSQLDRVRDLFTHFGGHEFACGFSLERARLPILKETLERNFSSIDDERYRRRALIDAEVNLDELTSVFLEEHEMLQPFGQANPQPLFLARDVVVRSRREFSPDCVELHLEQNGSVATAVLWPSTRELNPLLPVSARADVLFNIEPDRYAPAGLRLAIADAAVPSRCEIRNESSIDSVAIH